jgi:murein DD-endopeptidase MepM/ murein hydrolase activator NlpD
MANKNPKQKKKFKQKLIDKYRLVVLNEDTFEEKLSFKLNRLNVFIFGSVFSIFIIVGTIFLIAFTPLKEYIPGYSSTKLKKEATQLVYKTDSLEQVLKVNNQYLQNVRQLLTGKISEVKFDKDSAMQQIKLQRDSLNLSPSETDLDFRKEVESEDRFSLFNPAKKTSDIVFFAPITGIISDRFDIEKKHFAIDIAVAAGTPVKAVADGTVIFAGWTSDTGNVIILEHGKGFISVYKHNSILHKQEGDVVTSGEVIAASGNTGEFSTGAHLHFELWHDGQPVNPESYIDFE